MTTNEVRSQRGWDTLIRYVDVFDQGLDLSIDEDAEAAAKDLIADTLHALTRFTATVSDMQDVLDSALGHYVAEQAGED